MDKPNETIILEVSLSNEQTIREILVYLASRGISNPAYSKIEKILKKYYCPIL